jgi:putative hydrolase of the HAD superfamily
VLRALQPGFRLGLITNGAPEIQRVKIRATGLAPYFESVTISGEVGVGKPLKRIFEIALEQLGVAAAGAVMVGDSQSRDVRGAREAGIGSRWVNRTGARLSDRYPAPDAQVSDLSPLPELLARPNHG